MNKLLTATGLVTLLVLGGCTTTETKETTPVATETPKTETVVTTPAPVVVEKPEPAVVAEPTPAVSSETEHTVAKGDTLYNISKRYGVTVAEIQKWNKIKGNSIKLGQTLRVAAP